MDAIYFEFSKAFDTCLGQHSHLEGKEAGAG